MRRRSTLHWANSDPRSRQSKLEAVEAERLVISWFSIHHDEWEEPIYISEIMENCMNPSFSFFDLDASIASTVRSDEFTLRVWAKTDLADEHRILVELRVNMRSLQFIGRSLEHFHHPLPENCVLLHLSDGIYTSFTDLPAEVAQQPPLTKAMRTMPPTPIASFDALLKLANLDDVIQDALRTRAVLEADINQLLAQTSNTEHAISQLSAKRQRLRHTKSAKDQEQKAIENSTKAKCELESSLRARQKLMETAAAERHNGEGRRKQLGQESQSIRKQLQALDEDSSGQTRRICTSLQQIFPIDPIKNKTLQFTIRNLYLPNSTFSDTNRDEIAAALGFTAQLVHMLSLYLSIPLPYPIELGEAMALICDEISAGIAQRQFPLQPSGPAYKFEYGVFLLNKNIEFLLNRSGLRVMDIRHTLPNLKYLMFVLTAGTGELPDRKAGGIRGLLRGRLTPNASRRNSDDSVTSQTSTPILEGRQGNLAQPEKPGHFEDVFNSSVRARGLPYRKSMLRDAG